MQANSALLFLPVPTTTTTTKAKLNLDQQHFIPLKIAPLSSPPARPVPAGLKKPATLRVLPTQTQQIQNEKHNPKERSKLGKDWDWVVVGAVSLGVAVVMMSFDEQKAWAFGPEGPLVEEFWDNMRRYALYALTVSTGALYIVFQPILELLKNPISAILVLAIAAGGFYIVSQVVSAMVGVSDFSYEYSY